MAKDLDDNYVVQIDKAILMVRQCRISSAIWESHARMRLEKNNQISNAENTDLHQRNWYLRPSRTQFSEWHSTKKNGGWVCGFIYIQWTFRKKSFKFEHVKIRSITLHRNGDVVPFESIEMDLNMDESKCFQQGYLSLLQGTGRLCQDQGFHITPEEYINGNYLFAFDLSSNNSGCGQFEL